MIYSGGLRGYFSVGFVGDWLDFGRKFDFVQGGGCGRGLCLVFLGGLCWCFGGGCIGLRFGLRW